MSMYPFIPPAPPTCPTTFVSPCRLTAIAKIMLPVVRAAEEL